MQFKILYSSALVFLFATTGVKTGEQQTYLDFYPTTGNPAIAAELFALAQLQRVSCRRVFSPAGPTLQPPVLAIPLPVQSRPQLSAKVQKNRSRSSTGRQPKYNPLAQ